MTAVLTGLLGLAVGIVLGGLGGGGSVLAVPALIYGAGQTFQAATTTSLVVVGALAAAGGVRQWRAHQVDVRGALLFGGAGSAGAVLGTLANQALDEGLLTLAFAVLALGVAGVMLADRSPQRPPTEAGGKGAGRYGRLLLAGSAVGLLTGLFGVGGGFIVVPALVVVLGYPIRLAVGTSLVVIVINAAVALASRAGDLAAIDWTVVGPFVAAGLAGVWLGSAVAARADGRRLRMAFAILLAAVALLTGVDGLVTIF